MDIERLPTHLLTEILPSQDTFEEVQKQKEYEDEIQADNHSLEHQDNVEEFKQKGRIFSLPTLPPV